MPVAKPLEQGKRSLEYSSKDWWDVTYFDDETRCLRVGALIMTNSVQRFYEGQGRIGF